MNIHHRLIKRDGGTGPMKSRQQDAFTVPIPVAQLLEDKSTTAMPYLPIF